MSTRWIVLREGTHLRWGGDLRRHHVLRALAARSDAMDVDGWSAARVDEALARVRRLPWQARPRLAAATMLAGATLDRIGERATPFVVDFHDDPVAQNRAVGIEGDAEWTDRMTQRKRRNLEAFRWQVVPSRELAELAGLDLDRTIVAGNGTDTSVIQPRPWPTDPAVGFMSGAAPTRGIEALISATRLVRSAVPDLKLLLWLAATGTASEAYLASLRLTTAEDPWIEFLAAPYAEMGDQLGRATVQCIPNPPSSYWDSVCPIKLYDSMASGRPVVVTPRVAMRAVVERNAAGLVAPGDAAEDLAGAILTLLEDQALARRSGQNGRRAAVEDHDWRVISAHLADTLTTLAD
jgi:glycosyltransferase involved in cell wall biosynthesis